MIKTVFLDLDDTILDFHKSEREAIKSTLTHLGIDAKEEVLARYSEINKTCWERLERGEYTREEVLLNRFKLLFLELGLDTDPKIAKCEYEERLANTCHFVDGAIELLENLKGKYDLYITSNGTKRVQTKRLELADISKYFEEIFISEDIGANKPNIAFFERVFSKIKGFDKSKAIIVGDSLSSDILGGINAGILTCLFNPKKKPNATEIKPDYEINSLDQLTKLLERI